jgi:Tol biopolymer transport system component
MRRYVLLAAIAVAGFALVPIASTATVTNLAFVDLTGTLFLTSGSGTNPATLYDASVQPGVESYDFSNDNQRVLVLTANTEKLATIPVGGGNPTEISGTDNATSGTFSPDGGTVVFSTTGGIYTVPAGGGSPKQIVSTPASDVDTLPAYSPDGKKIAFVRNDGTTGTIELVSSSGGAVTDVTTGALADPGQGGRVSFSRDGKTLLFAGSYDSLGVWTVPAGGGSKTRLTNQIDLWPGFGPDGSKIYFSRDSYSPGADDQQPTPVSPSPNDVDELWSMSSSGDNIAVISEGDYEFLVVGGTAPPPPPTTTSKGGGSTTTTGGTTTTTKTTTSSKPAKKNVATAIKVTQNAKKHQVKVTWKGTAPKWLVTVKVGKKTYGAKVKGTVHTHTFVVKVAGKPNATVKATK